MALSLHHRSQLAISWAVIDYRAKQLDGIGEKDHKLERKQLVYYKIEYLLTL